MFLEDPPSRWNPESAVDELYQIASDYELSYRDLRSPQMKMRNLTKRSSLVSGPTSKRVGSPGEPSGSKGSGSLSNLLTGPVDGFAEGTR